MDSAEEDGGGRLADAGWFVAASYIFAFLPWAVNAAVDHVDQRWSCIHGFRRQTALAIGVCCVAVYQLSAYALVQFFAEDWKEAMAASVVLIAASWPIAKLLRQWWALSASTDLGRALSGMPSLGCDAERDKENGYRSPGNSSPYFGDGCPGQGEEKVKEKVCWNPGISSQFFDSWEPCQGVCGVSLNAAWLQWGRMLRARKELVQGIILREPVCAKLFTGQGLAPFYDGRRCELALDIVRYQLRILVSSGLSIKEQKRSTMEQRWSKCSGCSWNWSLTPLTDFWVRFMGRKADANGLTRGLWLYENLMGQACPNERRGKLAHVLQLGLVAHVGVVVVQGFAPDKLDWVNLLAGPCEGDVSSSELRRPAFGHLKTPGLLLQEWFPTGELTWFEQEDFDQVFAKLPPKRSSLRRNGHLRWEDVTFMACSTIELHDFVEALLGTHILDLKDMIWKYIAGAFVANRCVHGEQATLRVAIEDLRHPYKAAVKRALINGDRANDNWQEIVSHCGQMADVVVEALRRKGRRGTHEVRMPDTLKSEEWRCELLEIKHGLDKTLRRLLPATYITQGSGQGLAISTATWPSIEDLSIRELAPGSGSGSTGGLSSAAGGAIAQGRFMASGSGSGHGLCAEAGDVSAERKPLAGGSGSGHNG
eukprot:evm.model.scf_10EXC.4 EVM.evm.TU.scf_10EXC.4   scf_10EXC:212748-214700(-)